MRLLIRLLILALAAVQPASSDRGPCTAPEHHQFDFWIGNWEVRAGDRRLLGTNRITSILGGCALQEEWTSANGKVRGVSLNSYDPIDRRWHQAWVDTGPSRLTLSGGLVDGRMVMEQRTPAQSGAQIDVQRITWTPLADGGVRQQWEASTDGGAHWTTAFDGYYVRTTAAPPP